MNLFALTSNNERRIVRIPLTADLQTELTGIFQKQEEAFKAQSQEKIVFDGKYKPDSGECLSITDYDDIDELHYAVANPTSISEIRSDPIEFGSIKALFMGRSDAGQNLVLVQSFDKRKVLSTKGFFAIYHSGDTYKKLDGIGLTIDNKLSAILCDQELRFFSFHTVRQIFDLSQYYKEATDDDLKVFSSNPFVKISDFGDFVGVSDTWVRRKVALVMQSGILEKIDLEEAKKAAATFKINIDTEILDDKTVIVLPKGKADLKRLLRFLDEDYFQSALLNNPHLSNSKRPV